MSKYVVTLDKSIREEQSQQIWLQLQDKPDGPWLFPEGVRVHDLEHGEFYETDRIFIPGPIAVASLITNGVLLLLVFLRLTV